jgi:hypothetical protein
VAREIRKRVENLLQFFRAPERAAGFASFGAAALCAIYRADLEYLPKRPRKHRQIEIEV